MELFSLWSSFRWNIPTKRLIYIVIKTIKINKENFKILLFRFFKCTHVAPSKFGDRSFIFLRMHCRWSASYRNIYCFIILGTLKTYEMLQFFFKKTPPRTSSTMHSEFSVVFCKKVWEFLCVYEFKKEIYW